jgi:hypothetical protein
MRRLRHSRVSCCLAARPDITRREGDYAPMLPMRQQVLSSDRDVELGSRRFHRIAARAAEFARTRLPDTSSADCPDLAPIGLHPIAGFRRNQGRCPHWAVHSLRGQLPIQHVPGRSCFVAGPQIAGRSQLPNQFLDPLQTIGDDPQRTDLSVRFGDGSGDGVRVDILACGRTLDMATNSFPVRLCAARCAA